VTVDDAGKVPDCQSLNFNCQESCTANAVTHQWPPTLPAATPMQCTAK